MKNLSKLFTISLGFVLISCTVAMAETTQFTPLNFSDSSSVKATTSSSAISGTEPKKTDLLEPNQVVAGPKMQNAILQIDNAQVEMRNKLLNYRTNYTEIDSKYNTVKSERKAAKKQIKYAERKIKNLERAKTKIRKNFERQMNI